MINRERRRTKLASRFKAKRKRLKATVVDATLEFEDRMAAQQKLQALPKDSSSVRGQRRCRVCGRPHAVYRKFGLCRSHLRQLAMTAKIPGLTKASW